MDTEPSVGGQDDTPKRKMVRARLPSIAKRLIQFECGADTTVQFRSAIAFPHSAFARARPWTRQRVTGRGPSARRVARIHQIAPVDFVESRRGIV